MRERHRQPQQVARSQAKALEFLQLLDGHGWHNLVALPPEGGPPLAAETFAPDSWRAISAFVERWEGTANIYFSANEPAPNAPSRKLAKENISSIRCLYVDRDPEKGVPFEQARRDLDREAETAEKTSLPPSLILDSGGGNQMLWLLATKLPATAETVDRAEAQGRALSNIYGGDRVQNVDRLLRLPGTINIPSPSKRASGRVERLATLLSSTDRKYDLGEFETGISQFDRDAPDENTDRYVSEAEQLIDYTSAALVSSLDDLDADLRHRFDRACAGSGSLAALWRGDKGGLCGSDTTDSGWRLSLARRMALAGEFDADDYAQIVHAWPAQAHARDKMTLRALSREWGKFGAPVIAERRELIDRFWVQVTEEPPVARTGIAWIDPRRWEGLEPKPREWEVEGWIPRGEVTLLYGDGGIGKTLLAHQYATAAASGRSWLGQPTRKARVMAFLCEDSADELHRRQVDINHMLGVSPSDLDGLRLVSRKNFDNLLGRWDRDKSKLVLTPLWHALCADARAFGADVLIVDTIADTYGGSEIDRVQVNAFVKTCLGGLASAIGGSVIALGHPSVSGKSSGDGTSGSTAWNNASRSRLYLRYPGKVTKGDIRELAGMKMNYGARGSVLKLKWQRGAFAVIAGATPATGNATAGSVPNLRDAAEFAVIAALIENVDVRMSQAPNSPHYAPKVLQKRSPDTLAAFNPEEIVAALGRLEHRGAIRFGEIARNEQRKPVRGYVLIADKLSEKSISGDGVFQ